MHDRESAERPLLGRSLAAAALVCACFAGPSWAGETVSSDAVRQNLYATCFVDDRVGWAVGDLGRIFRTDDATATWNVQSAGVKRPFVAAACVDADNAFIAGQAGQIARTSDAGATWTMLDSGVDRQLLSIAFADARTGIAVGDYGTILRTEDAGATWTRVPVPTETQLPEEYFGIVEPGDIVLYSVQWSSAEHVSIAGEFGVILVSNDGGRTFAPQSSGVDTTLFGIFFADDQRGWAVGMESVLLSTVDGGATWKRERIQTPPGFSLALYDLEVRGNRGWAVGNSGFLLTSDDAGVTWKLVQVPPQMGSYWFREVSLLASGKGFVVGSTGMVLTLDGAGFKANKDEL